MPDSWIEEFLVARPQYREHADLLVIPPTIQEVIEEFVEADCEIDLQYGEMRFASGCHDGKGHGLTTLALYVIARRNLATHEFAMMLALQKPPGIETNDSFWAGRKRFDQVFGEEYANRIRSGLAAKGINLGATGEYMPELVRPGMGFGPKNPDPQAVVPFHGGRDYIRKMCESRGWACNGAVTVKEREPLSDPLGPENCAPLHSKLVDELAIRECRKNPDLQQKTKRELREMIVDKHGHKP
jgi:hypothetical protein